MKILKGLNRGILMIAMTVGASLLPTQAHGGGAHGGGGHHSCQEYVGLAGRIVYELTKIEKNQPELIKSLPIELNRYKEILKGAGDLKKPLTCLPVEQLDRDARSYQDSNSTNLLWQSWNNLILPKKIQLTVHELCVLAGDEVDGQYNVSKDILAIVMQSSSTLKYELQAESVRVNNNKTVTFIRPLAEVNGEIIYFGYHRVIVDSVYALRGLIGTRPSHEYSKTDTYNICKFLGFKRPVSMSLSEFTLEKIAAADNRGNLLIPSMEGRFSEEDSSLIDLSVGTNKYHAFETLTCE